MKKLRSLSKVLVNGDITASELARDALLKARKSESVFVALNEQLEVDAESVDRSRQLGRKLPPLAGIPITLKDLFNIKGQLTLAGSMVLKRIARAETRDADVVTALRDAGMLFLGRTNMSEFAFSGMGINHHYGTPLSIWDRQVGHIPGGSSSGSAVSVAEDIVVASLGSDTAGSCRIPAAFNGIVGVKPSYGRMSLRGIYPLSPSSDAPGPLATDVDSCFILDQLMCGASQPGDQLPELPVPAPATLRLVIPESRVLDDLDDEVQFAFNRSVDTLRAAGTRVDYVKMPVIDTSMDLFHQRAIVVYEVYQHLKELLEHHGDEFDPLVRQRISSGSQITLEDQKARYLAKTRVIEQFEGSFKSLGVDGIIYPTTACLPPTLAETANMQEVGRINLRCLRNTATVNYFDGCSISLPCHVTGEPPVGLMVSSMNGEDDNLFAVCAAIESILQN